jgi:hypothetical protein
MCPVSDFKQQDFPRSKISEQNYGHPRQIAGILNHDLARLAPVAAAIPVPTPSTVLYDQCHLYQQTERI